jgi:hypothetical protein
LIRRGILTAVATPSSVGVWAPCLDKIPNGVGWFEGDEEMSDCRSVGEDARGVGLADAPE